MPVIEGKKMACEPCIRGHRSTKCAHTDRTMVEVRKPGRPLSSCPHPHGQRCNCAGVTTTVAIPRRTQCGCSTTSPLTATGAVIKTEGPISEPPSPSGKPQYRVSKTSQKHARKQSLAPEMISRMDPSTVNVVNPYNTTTYANATDSNGGHAMTAQFPTGFQNGYGPLAPAAVRSTGHYHMPDPLQPHAQVNGAVNGFHPINTNTLPRANSTSDVSPTFPVANGMNGSPSCCSGTSGQSSVAQHTPNSSVGSGGYDAAATKAAIVPTTTAGSTTNSCCGSASKAQPSNGHPMSAGNADLQAFPSAPTFESRQASNGHQEATVFMLPSAYGSFQHPLNQAQWVQNIGAYAYSQSTPQSPTGFANGNASLPLGLNGNGVSVDNMGTTHECRCGPSCNCIGCAVHPFNQATHEYIASALKSQNGRVVPDALESALNGHGPMLAQADDLAPADTPSDTTSAASNDDVYPANEYYFFQYQICEGQGQTCPCGDDCQCIGCIIHGNVPAN